MHRPSMNQFCFWMILGMMMITPTLALSAPSEEELFFRLSQIRGQKARATERKERALAELDDKISSQNLAPENVSEQRLQIQQVFKKEMNILQHDEDALLSQLDAKAAEKKPKESSRPAPSQQIPSQQIIEFTPSGTKVSIPEERRQKNVDIGVRSIEY